MRKLVASVLLLCVTLAATACDRHGSQSPAPPLATPEQSPERSQQPPPNTAAFVEGVATSIDLEIGASRVAAQRTASGDVRRLAQHFTKDGVDALRTLGQLTRDQRPQRRTLDPIASTIIDNISGANVETFDARYLDAVVGAQQDIIDALERYAQSGEEVSVRTWAQTWLPPMRARLQEADAMRQLVNASEQSAVGAGNSLNGLPALR